MFIISFIIDLSGAVNSASEFLFKKLHPLVKYDGWMIPLISCSLCVCLWTVLLFSLLTSHSILISLFAACLSAYLIQFIQMIQYKFRDIIIELINMIKFNKNDKKQ